MGWKIDSEQYSKKLQLDLIAHFANFSCKLGNIMTRYDVLWARQVILSNVLMWVGANNDQMMSHVRTDVTFHENYAPNLIEFKHSGFLVLWTCVILLENNSSDKWLNSIILTDKKITKIAWNCTYRKTINSNTLYKCVFLYQNMIEFQSLLGSGNGPIELHTWFDRNFKHWLHLYCTDNLWFHGKMIEFNH